MMRLSEAPLPQPSGALSTPFMPVRLNDSVKGHSRSASLSSLDQLVGIIHGRSKDFTFDTGDARRGVPHFR